MSKLFAWFAFLGSCLLAISLFWIWREYNPEWRRYQREFQNLSRQTVPAAAKTEPGQEGDPLQSKATVSVPYEIHQRIFDDLKTVDRCETCHLRIEERPEGKWDEPYRAHPAPYVTWHSVDDLGCTTCHQGQGRALTAADAHGDVPHWSTPLLRGRYLQSSCGVCHDPLQVRGAPALNAGTRIMTASRCIGCHKIEGYEKKEYLAPNLTGVGSKASPAWLYSWLKYPKGYLPETAMPNFIFKDDEASNLTAYLASLGERKTPPVANLSDPALIEEGHRLLDEKKCVTCHNIEGHELEGFLKTEKIGPDLSRVGEKVDPGWLVAWLKNPKDYQQNTRMPHFRLSDNEVSALAAHLLTLRKETPQAPPGGNSEEGRKLVTYYGCYGCHGIKGFEAQPTIGVALTEVGSKQEYELDFGVLTVQDTSLPNWLELKLTDPRRFREGLKMPNFSFSEEDAKSLTTFLLSRKKSQLPSRFLKLPAPVQEFRPAGDFGALASDLNCQVCHKINGTGGTIGPDLSHEGSRVKSDWLVRFLKQPYAIRPINQAKMPTFGLSDTEAAVAAQYISLFLLDEKIQVGVVIGEVTAQDTPRAEQLFQQVYACMGCHTLNGKGGRVGPDLSKAGERLKADWMYAWIQNPQAVEPSAIMPNMSVSEANAMLLAKYLAAQKGD